MSSLAFRNLLEAGDVAGLMAAWGEIFPNMPQPEDFRQAEIIMHLARTSADSVAFSKRAYSHRWLEERALPSQLPDGLRPKAERMYPVTTEAVGISVNFRNQWMKPAEEEVRKAMEDAVNDAFAENRRDPTFVTSRMVVARDKTYQMLFGRRDLGKG